MVETCEICNIKFKSVWQAIKNHWVCVDCQRKKEVLRQEHKQRMINHYREEFKRIK